MFKACFTHDAIGLRFRNAIMKLGNKEITTVG